MDIDGVLNSRRSEIAHAAGFLPSPNSPWQEQLPRAFQDIDWIAVGMIHVLCTRLDAKIVISSSWRANYKPEQLAKYFNLPMIIDATDQLESNRGGQIQRWLNAHPEVTQYAIVDDNSGMLESQADHFVQVDWDEGLTYKDCSRLRDILQGIFAPQPRNPARFILFDEI